MMPDAEDFRQQLTTEFANAMAAKHTYIDVRSGDLHTTVGGYPGHDHRMPVCCSVMYAEMRTHDIILDSPPSGKGASLVIRYKLPR